LSKNQELFGLYAGLMSGTSLDGIDVALVDIAAPDRITLRAFESYAYTPAQRDRLLKFIGTGDGGSTPLAETTLLHTDIGIRFGEALSETLARHAPGQRVLAIGSHGQTVWHHPPDARGHGTLQLGAAAEIAIRAGCPVVSDFRAADMAVGGQGAPLVPIFHRDCLHLPGQGLAVHNVGGIANLTYIDPQSICRHAFDTGPGNMVIDALMRRHFDKAYDEGGQVAAAGRVHDGLLSALKGDPYITIAPPKSTGRELYGAPFLDRFLQQAASARVAPEDQIATATRFTAWSMAQAYRQFILPAFALDRILICGGGAYNPTLLRELAVELPSVPIQTVDVAGIRADAVEAVAFAYLAYLRLAGRPGNVPAATGATREVVLGAVTDLAPPL
jgi:anhydro-N-acetylmuramic acid kinase